MPGHTKRSHVLSARAHEYVDAEKLPATFVWNNVKGHNFLTSRSTNTFRSTAVLAGRTAP